MDNVNKTLFIPLYGKAYVSRKGILLQDTKAEQIWKSEAFPLKRKAGSKWLAYYMGMRSAVFDRWLREKMAEFPDAVILHLGCGMDSRVHRIGTQGHAWFDVDFSEVIEERRRYFEETSEYHMISSDIRNTQWLQNLPDARMAIVIMEGISMYLKPAELAGLAERLKLKFSCCHILMDCYTELAARTSKYKNPINEVGVTLVYGLDDPMMLGLKLVKEHNMTPDDLIDQLTGKEKWVFRKVYAGSFARKLYRLYEFIT